MHITKKATAGKMTIYIMFVESRSSKYKFKCRFHVSATRRIPRQILGGDRHDRNRVALPVLDDDKQRRDAQCLAVE